MSVDMRTNAVIEKGDLLDVACDLHYASQLLDDIGLLMHELIHDKPSMDKVKTLARLIQSQSQTWAGLLESTQKNLETIVGYKVLQDE